MKKYLYLFTAAIMVFYYACSTGPDQPVQGPESEMPKSVEIGEADAEAAVEAAEEFEYMTWMGPYGEALYVGTIGVLSAEASIAAAEMYVRPHRDPVFTVLPEKYRINGNKYEAIGQAHNVSIDQLKRTIQSGDLKKLIDQHFLDQTGVIQKVTETLADGTVDPKTVAATISHEMNQQSLQRADWNDKYVSTNRFAIGNELENTGNGDIKDYMVLFHQKLTKSNSHSIQRTMEMINAEILWALNQHNDDKLQADRLIYLSVLKNSIYYWSKN